MKRLLLVLVSFSILIEPVFANDLICTRSRPGRLDYGKMIVSENPGQQVLIKRFLDDGPGFQTFSGKKVFDEHEDDIPTKMATIPDINQDYPFGYVNELRYYITTPPHDFPGGDNGPNYGFSGGIGLLVYEFSGSDGKQYVGLRIYSLKHQFWVDQFNCGAKKQENHS